jgi:hypothetical protein
MINNHTWEEETRKYLSDAQAELNAVDKQLEELREKSVTLAREIDAYQIALEGHLRRTGRQASIAQNLRNILESQPNHEERLRRIAERNGGVIKVGSATDLLFNLRLIKSKSRQHAYRIVYGLLLGMVEEGQFVKIAPATFRLKGSQTPLPGTTRL